MQHEKKKFDEKVKRFDRCFVGIITNIGVSMLTTLILLERLGVLK